MGSGEIATLAPRVKAKPRRLAASHCSLQPCAVQIARMGVRPCSSSLLNSRREHPFRPEHRGAYQLRMKLIRQPVTEVNTGGGRPTRGELEGTKPHAGERSVLCHPH